jgi:HAD superfamily phosphoserine phosphatase-like hydrolase
MDSSMLDETIELIQNDAWRMGCLQAVAYLRLPDWYIAAGFLRNAIWDVRHAKLVRTPLNDVDVVYFDLRDHGTDAETRIESVLQTRCPDVKWEVRNQARMHLRNGHPPYRDSEDAIAHWVETPTCVGVRIEGNRTLRIVAPYDIAENRSLRVAPNPRIVHPAALFNERIRAKRWLEYWPNLSVEWAGENRLAPALVVFDLDGTLLRGDTVCELLARPLGRLDRMRQLERFSSEADLAAARAEMATWYRAVAISQLTAGLHAVPFAPGAEEAVALLRRSGITVAIASITWEFAVACFAQRLSVTDFVGTRLAQTGAVEHVWPRDKATWAQALCRRLSIPPHRLVAVGDSSGDVELLRIAAHRVFVGENLPPELPDVYHAPRADVLAVTWWIMRRLDTGT